MSLRDLRNNLGAAESVRPAVHADSVTGEIVDTRGFDSAMVLVQTGAIAGAGDFTPKLQHSDTTTGGDFADVESADLLGKFPAILTANGVTRVGYAGPKRYLRAVLTKNGGTSIAASASVVLGHPHQRPVA